MNIIKSYSVIVSSAEGYYTGRRGDEKWSKNIADAKRYFSNRSADYARVKLKFTSEEYTTVTLAREVKS